MGKEQSQVGEDFGAQAGPGEAGVGLERVPEPGEEILESSEGGREGRWGPTNQREEPTRQDTFQSRALLQADLLWAQLC